MDDDSLQLEHPSEEFECKLQAVVDLAANYYYEAADLKVQQHIAAYTAEVVAAAEEELERY